MRRVTAEATTTSHPQGDETQSKRRTGHRKRKPPRPTNKAKQGKVQSLGSLGLTNKALVCPKCMGFCKCNDRARPTALSGSRSGTRQAIIFIYIIDSGSDELLLSRPTIAPCLTRPLTIRLLKTTSRLLTGAT